VAAVDQRNVIIVIGLVIQPGNVEVGDVVAVEEDRGEYLFSCLISNFLLFSKMFFQ